MNVTYNWTIWRAGDVYRMLRSDGVEVTPAPVGQLYRALSSHLILADQYNDVVQQLLTTGCAETTVTIVGNGIKQLN